MGNRGRAPSTANGIGMGISVLRISRALSLSSAGPMRGGIMATHFGRISTSALFGMGTRMDRSRASIHLSFRGGDNTRVATISVPTNSNKNSNRAITAGVMLGTTMSGTVVGRNKGTHLACACSRRCAAKSRGKRSAKRGTSVAIAVEHKAAAVCSRAIDSISGNDCRLSLSDCLLIKGASVCMITAAASPAANGGRAQRTFASIGIIDLSLADSCGLTKTVTTNNCALTSAVGVPCTIDNSKAGIIALCLGNRRRGTRAVAESKAAGNDFDLSPSSLMANQGAIRVITRVRTSTSLILGSRDVCVSVLGSKKSTPFVNAVVDFPSNHVFARSRLIPHLRTKRCRRIGFSFITCSPTTAPTGISICQSKIRARSIDITHAARACAGHFARRNRVGVGFGAKIARCPFCVSIERDNVSLRRAATKLMLGLSTTNQDGDRSSPKT